jgi:hypothetical protein
VSNILWKAADVLRDLVMRAAMLTLESYLDDEPDSEEEEAIRRQEEEEEEAAHAEDYDLRDMGRSSLMFFFACLRSNAG